MADAKACFSASTLSHNLSTSFFLQTPFIAVRTASQFLPTEIELFDFRFDVGFLPFLFLELGIRSVDTSV